MPRRSTQAVDADRTLTLQTAVDVASVVGLEGLTIGRLAERLDMSKSGLAGRFGSKQQLQLATLELAAGMFQAQVYDPAARAAPPGRERLLAICERWIEHLGGTCFPGGCFLTSASVEFDAREGAVHDAVKGTLARWLGALAAEARTAIEAGELPAASDPAEIAFTLNALAMGTNCDFQLHRRQASLERGLRAMRAVLAPAG